MVKRESADGVKRQRSPVDYTIMATEKQSGKREVLYSCKRMAEARPAFVLASKMAAKTHSDFVVVKTSTVNMGV